MRWGLGGWMVQDALVVAALHLGFHIGWGISLGLRCMWVQIPPLYKINCTYLIYYLWMSATACAPWYNWNQLASKWKTAHINWQQPMKIYKMMWSASVSVFKASKFRVSKKLSEIRTLHEKQWGEIIIKNYWWMNSKSRDKDKFTNI